MHLFAGAAAAAGDVERDRYQVADLHALDVAALLDDFTGDFVAQDQADLGSSAATDHVLVRTADVGGDHLQDDAVFDFLAARVLHFRVVDLLYFDLASAEIHHSTIARHALTSLDFYLCSGG